MHKINVTINRQGLSAVCYWIARLRSHICCGNNK